VRRDGLAEGQRQHLRGRPGSAPPAGTEEDQRTSSGRGLGRAAAGGGEGGGGPAAARRRGRRLACRPARRAAGPRREHRSLFGPTDDLVVEFEPAPAPLSSARPLCYNFHASGSPIAKHHPITDQGESDSDSRRADAARGLSRSRKTYNILIHMQIDRSMAGTLHAIPI
jgi:hypothetical protein